MRGGEKRERESLELFFILRMTVSGEGRGEKGGQRGEGGGGGQRRGRRGERGRRGREREEREREGII